MKGQLLMRRLSTGDFLLFPKSGKNLYVIDAKHVKEWNASGRTSAALRKMIKVDHARRFNEKMLRQLQKAISRVNFKL